VDRWRTLCAHHPPIWSGSVPVCVFVSSPSYVLFSFAACGDRCTNRVLRQYNYPRLIWMRTGCVFSGHRPSVHSFILHSPLYSVRRISTLVENALNWQSIDLAAFLVVYLRTRALKTQHCDSNTLNILDTVTRDTAMYFLVIFSSHFVLVLTLTSVEVRCSHRSLDSNLLTILPFQPILRFLPTV
jgi:hypothetical protein